MKKKVLVIGSINMDYVIHTERLPKLGETLTGSEFSVNYGGKGANQASALGKSGCQTKMLGMIGNDNGGKSAKANLERFNVDCASVLTTDEVATGSAVITVCGGDNMIILDKGANDKITPDVIKANADLFDWADMVVMQFEIPMESVLFAAKLAKSKGKTVVVNPAPVKDCDKALFSYVDYLIPNEFECQLLTGVYPDAEHEEEAVKAVLALGCAHALITVGKRGCIFDGTDGKLDRFGIFDIKVVDTTAAGDSFIGGLCSQYVDHAHIRDAIRYATAVSTLTVSRKGAADAIPTEDEVVAFLKKQA